MQTVIRLLLTWLLGALLMADPVMGLDQLELIVLKQAGIEDETVRVIMREKVVETAAFTVDDIVAMKKAGLTGATIRMIIEERSFLRNRTPIVYGKDVRPTRLVTVDDIIKLKESGISDDVIQAIIYVLQNNAGRDRNKAWEMLRDMDIRIDMR